MMISINLVLGFVAAVANIADCGPLPPRSNPPVSIKDVRVDDVKVIAALGDSITAGFGANGLSNPNQNVGLNSLVENRGVSFSIGGDPGAVTLGNYVARFSPNVVGRSVGSHGPNICTPSFCLGRYTPEIDRFNAARTGSVSSNFNNQISWLVGQMRNNRAVNFQNDYKLLTILIGANDVCNSCNTQVTPDTYEANMRRVLEDLRRQIPRLIVNIHQLFKVSQLWDLSAESAFCDRQRASIFTAECTCAFLEGANGVAKRQQMDQLTDQYNQRLDKIAAEYKATNSDTFMVISDPSASGFQLKNATLDYLSNTDCFHPSRKAHALLATASFNNLFLPAGQKKLVTSLELDVTCPTVESRIRN